MGKMLCFSSIMCWLHRGKGMGSPVLCRYITGSNLTQEFNPKLSKISESLISGNQYSGTHTHTQKEQIEIVWAKNIELSFWMCSEFSFQWNKGRNYLKV